MSARDKKLLIVVGAIIVVAVGVFVVRGFGGKSGAPAATFGTRETAQTPTRDAAEAPQPPKEEKRTRRSGRSRDLGDRFADDQPESDEIAAGQEDQEEAAGVGADRSKRLRSKAGSRSGRSRRGADEEGDEEDAEEEKEERMRGATGAIDV